jgi:dihydrofolate reductase
MRKIIEYTLVSLDGVFAGPGIAQFHQFRDDAYYRDGLGQLLACDAMLMGRTTYEAFATLWPGRDHPWADAINAIRKYVFSSTLERAEWHNSVIVRGDVVPEAARLKEEAGRNLLIWGHGRLGETLFRHGLVDVLDLSVHPLLLGSGLPFSREGQTSCMRLIATKAFTSGIVKLTYEPISAGS